MDGHLGLGRLERDSRIAGAIYPACRLTFKIPCVLEAY